MGFKLHLALQILGLALVGASGTEPPADSCGSDGVTATLSDDKLNLEIYGFPSLKIRRRTTCGAFEIKDESPLSEAGIIGVMILCGACLFFLMFLLYNFVTSAMHAEPDPEYWGDGTNKKASDGATILFGVVFIVVLLLGVRWSYDDYKKKKICNQLRATIAKSGIEYIIEDPTVTVPRLGCSFSKGLGFLQTDRKRQRC